LSERTTVAQPSLDRRQLADQRMALDHLLHPEREADRHDGRQAFGHCRDRQADRGHEEVDDVLLLGLQPASEADLEHVDEARVAEQAVDQHDRADRETRGAEHLAELLQLLLQRRVLVLVGLDHLGDHADLRVHAGPGDQALAAAVGHHGAHEGGVLAVAERDLLVEHHRGVLLHRHRLAGERGFFDLEVHARDQAHVRRDVVARFEQHEVAGHELAPRHRHLVAVADHLRVRRRHLLERGERLLGLRLLNHADHRVQHHDAHDRDRIDPLAEGERDQRGDDQDDDEVVVELVPEEREEAGPRLLGQLVRPEFLQSLAHFARGKAVLEVGLQRGDDSVDVLCVGFLVVHDGLPRVGVMAPTMRRRSAQEELEIGEGRHYVS
jgi:hypothetical protein